MLLQQQRRLVEPRIKEYPDCSKRFHLPSIFCSRHVPTAIPDESSYRDRVVAYASNCSSDRKKNKITHHDGTSEIDFWGGIWATTKFRCYLNRHELDLYTDHNAETWAFTRTTVLSMPSWHGGRPNFLSCFKTCSTRPKKLGHLNGL